MGFPLTKATKKYQQRQVLSCVEINSLGLLEKKNYSYSFYFPYPFGSPRLHVSCQCLVLNLKQVCLKIPFVFGAEKWLEYYFCFVCVWIFFFFFKDCLTALWTRNLLEKHTNLLLVELHRGYKLLWSDSDEFFGP